MNDRSTTVFNLDLSSPQCIGCFDGDGIDTYGAPGNVLDTTGYGGPDTWFSNNTGYSLRANFIGGLAAGGTTYFSLEEPVNVSQLGTPEPATWAMMALGFVGLGFAGYRARNKAISIA